MKIVSHKAQFIWKNFIVNSFFPLSWKQEEKHQYQMFTFIIPCSELGTPEPPEAWEPEGAVFSLHVPKPTRAEPLAQSLHSGSLPCSRYLFPANSTPAPEHRVWIKIISRNLAESRPLMLQMKTSFRRREKADSSWSGSWNYPGWPHFSTLLCMYRYRPKPRGSG